MRVRTSASLMIICLSTWLATTADSAKETNMNTAQSQISAQTHTRAKAMITVQSSKAEPYDRNDGPALTEIHINEKFTGDMEGESTEARALQVGDQSARQVSMARFRGTLGGRQGTFVLQGSETIENGKINATWFVVPGSGNGDLSGLRGEGGFKGEFRKGSEGWLDYWFE